MITSYDYDAPLNEYGRVTPKYAVTKNLSYFVHAFGALLMETEEIPEEQIVVRHPEGISVRGRQANNQKIRSWRVTRMNARRCTLRWRKAVLFPYH